MIHYLVTEKHPYTIRRFLERWGAPVAPIVRLVTYEQTRCFLRGGSLRRRRLLGGSMRRVVNAWYEGRRDVRPAASLPRPPVGAWVFSDVDRLSPREREEAARFRDLLVATGAATSLHNDPLATMARYELLRTLFERGINAFDVYRLTEARRPRRYPVFLRTENDHVGAETPLLADARELDAAIEGLARAGVSREGRIVVEYGGAPDARGLHRKYSAWKIAGRIVPGHLFFGPDWMLKEPKVVDDEALREERRYLDENPHAAILDEVFRIARADYGRVDYGVVDGRVQIFELNTNPGIPSSPSPGPGARRAAIDAAFNETILERFRALDALPRQA
jgi:hypothetical protein